MSFAPALSRSPFMKGAGQELVNAMRAAGIDEVQIAMTVRRYGSLLTQRFGGQQVYVPRGRHDGDEQADKAMRLKAQGMATSDIAERMQMTERRVQQLLIRGAELMSRSTVRNAQGKP